MRKKNLMNRRFGRLKVVGAGGKDKRGVRLWLCECDCGRETLAYGHNLESRRTKSCGCLRAEFAKKILLAVRQDQERAALRVELFYQKKERASR